MNIIQITTSPAMQRSDASGNAATAIIVPRRLFRLPNGPWRCRFDWRHDGRYWRCARLQRHGGRHHLVAARPTAPTR
jgi:hypothetical protein